MTDQDTNPPNPDEQHTEQQRLTAAAHLRALMTERRPILREQAREARVDARDRERAAAAERVARLQREQRTSQLAGEIKETFIAAAAQLKSRGIAPQKAQGPKLNEPGPKKRNRINTLRHYTPADKLKSMHPKYGEADVWVLKQQDVKRGQYGLAFDADGNFYTLGSTSDPKDPRPFSVRPVEPAALGEGPDDWGKIYSQNPRPEITPDIVEEWQIAAADFVIAKTEPRP